MQPEGGCRASFSFEKKSNRKMVPTNSVSEDEKSEGNRSLSASIEAENTESEKDTEKISEKRSSDDRSSKKKKFSSSSKSPKQRVSNKTPKRAVAKASTKGDSTDKKRKKTRQDTYANFIYRLNKQIDPKMEVSKKTISILNSFVNDVFDRVATEAQSLLKHAKKDTLTAREIQAACRLVLPAELSQHAVAQSVDSLRKFEEKTRSSSKR
eukprot:Trichotokara_eunicae@DN6820_c0_g1_i1.p1